MIRKVIGKVMQLVNDAEVKLSPRDEWAQAKTALNDARAGFDAATEAQSSFVPGFNQRRTENGIVACKPWVKDESKYEASMAHAELLRAEDNLRDKEEVFALDLDAQEREGLDVDALKADREALVRDLKRAQEAIEAIVLQCRGRIEECEAAHGRLTARRKNDGLPPPRFLPSLPLEIDACLAVLEGEQPRHRNNVLIQLALKEAAEHKREADRIQAAIEERIRLREENREKQAKAAEGMGRIRDLFRKEQERERLARR